MNKSYCIGHPSKFSGLPCAVVKVSENGLSKALRSAGKLVEDLDYGQIDFEFKRMEDGLWIIFTLPPMRHWAEAAHYIKEGRKVPQKVVELIREDFSKWYSGQHLVNAAAKLSDWFNLSLIGELPLLEVGIGQKTFRWIGGICSQNNSLATFIGSDKNLGKSLLRAVQLPVADGGLVQTKREAENLANQIGYPVVLKTRFGANSEGVISSIQTQNQLITAFKILRRKFGQAPLLLERHLNGQYYRVLVIDGKIQRISKGSPKVITGDGESRISELAKIERLSGKSKQSRSSRIEQVLFNQSYKLSTILPKGVTARISTDTANWVGYTGHVHKTTKEKIETLGKWLSPSVLGIDIIARDFAKPLEEKTDGVLEFNPGPGWSFHDDAEQIGELMIKRLMNQKNSVASDNYSIP